jgi:hypothetical protein
MWNTLSSLVAVVVVEAVRRKVLAVVEVVAEVSVLAHQQSALVRGHMPLSSVQVEQVIQPTMVLVVQILHLLA